ncbi:MAG: hypothetical protein HOF96_09310 [Candidatus Marinimicrobia bacterium]|nr:hypothetical protein [Candidatus Neomarinimicrobiota bacterium]MBT4130687.1 hypothetical protein [Candidatus Neomarinimicrobiota bacterium]MBT4419948.1 hypothetical protein [Candidatus Neomarinimicrobiota bacterium]MBT4994671.1 hypothetical protein [Candidatus Neomarinimicrobiota bacterium]MBT5314670.1 hypothetical protein [Candidatus Neomarinimicrobiota bacterium]
MTEELVAASNELDFDQTEGIGYQSGLEREEYQRVIAYSFDTPLSFRKEPIPNFYSSSSWNKNDNNLNTQLLKQSGQQRIRIP